MKNNEIKISIIMPAYNCEKYIEEAIKSVINQTYTNWELIVINDRSIDKTSEIIKGFLAKDNRVFLVENKENIGVSKTRNKGIELIKGEFVAFLDSDDIWEYTKLEKQIKVMKELKAEFIFTGAKYITENNQAYSGIFEVPQKITYKKLLRQNVISCSSVMISKKALSDIRMNSDKMHEDYAMWLEILKSGYDAFGINEPLLIYRISRNSKSGNKLKTFKMTYKVFRFIGLNSVSSSYFTYSHIIKSVFKYAKIKGYI